MMRGDPIDDLSLNVPSADPVLEVARRMHRPGTPLQLRQARVTAVNADGSVDIRLGDAAELSTIPGVKSLRGVDVAEDDAVWCAQNGTDWIVLGALAGSESQWKALPLVGGWSAYAGGGSFLGPQYRVRGRKLEVRGLISHTVTSTTGNFAQIPSGLLALGGRLIWGVTSAGTMSGYARVDLLPTGEATVQAYGGGGAGAYLNLTNLPAVALD